MNSEQQAELRARFGTLVKFEVPLASLSTYRIGGPAAALVEPQSDTHVSEALRAAATMGLPWMALGLGSNLIGHDEGFDGIVIRLGRGMARVTRAETDHEIWTVGAGLPTPLLARRTAEAGLGGVQRLIGVPGTVGGGAFMNAGAHGQVFEDVVNWVDVVAGDGSTYRIERDKIPWRYRSSGLDSIVVRVQMSLTPRDPGELKRDIARYLRWRRVGTPFDKACCGSVFRNPTAAQLRDTAEEAPIGHTAGSLIDAAGLKGFSVGGAEVSHMHANYIVNTGAATAADVLGVIAGVRERVFERWGIELQLEVKVLEPR